jgi:hypothetical protein
MATAMAVGADIAAARLAPAAAPSGQDASRLDAPLGERPTAAGARANGDTKQSITTIDANASTPARGANSFTESEARTRIESNGFQGVGILQQDSNGIRRGQAKLEGRQADPWPDDGGNVGIGWT